jgi:hypothetical protein
MALLAPSQGDGFAAVEVSTFCTLTFGGGWAKLQKVEELTYGN